MSAMAVVVFPGRIFVGHLGLFMRPDGSGDFPAEEGWRHDLVEPLEAVSLMLDGLRSADGHEWPEGFRHVFITATGRGESEITFCECCCAEHLLPGIAPSAP